MKNSYKYLIMFLLMVVFFIPFYPVSVVPEWEIQFVNADGKPASSITIDQIWNHHSLEWGWGENSDLDLQTDSTGFIKLPARKIYVSIFKLVGSRIRDTVMSVNPHASFGPDSYVICKKSTKCVASYKNDSAAPQRVILW